MSAVVIIAFQYTLASAAHSFFCPLGQKSQRSSKGIWYTGKRFCLFFR